MQKIVVAFVAALFLVACGSKILAKAHSTDICKKGFLVVYESPWDDRFVKMRDFYGVVSAYALDKWAAKHGYIANSVKIHKLAKRVKHQNISIKFTL